MAILNDYPIVTAGLAAALEPFAARVEIVQIGTSDAPRAVDVDVVLVDTFGTDDARELAAAHPRARVVLFSWDTRLETIAAARARGAAGYVSKRLSADALVRAIERVHAGFEATPTTDAPTVTGRAGLRGRDGPMSWPGRDDGLSQRESEVLSLLAEGLTNNEIADHLFLSPNTVKTYLRTAYAKARVSSRSQAVLWMHSNSQFGRRD